MDVESRIEPLCNTILRCDAENWDTRNKAVLQIIDIVRSYEGQSLTTISDAFGPSVFRLLKEPVKSLISDLRSQQVRDVCTLLVTLAKVTGERMKPFLRDSFAHIIEGVKVPNKVMSGYVDDCIQNMIQYCTFKSCIPVILMEFKDNKAKTFREKCLEYLNSILLFWDMTEKDLEPICDALKIGLEDASPKARETARTVFQSLYNINPRRAERLRSDLPRSVQAKLQVDETSALETSTSSIVLDQPLPEPPRTAERPRMMHASQSMSSHKLHTSGSSHSMSGLARADMSKSFSGSTVASSSLFAPSSSVEPPSAPEPVVDTPAPSSTSRASVMSAKAAAAAASSAGSRRRSVVKNPFADISDSFAQGNSLSNSLSSSQEFPSAFPKMSPSKPSPTSNKSKTSPAIASEYSGYNSGASSPAGGVISRSAPFQDSRPFSNLSDSRPVNGNFSASTTLESLGSVNSTSSAASVPESKALTLHGRVYAQIAKDNRVAATVRFIGQTQFAPGTWVGVELDTPMGKNNGSVQGIAYFNCRMNFGLFLREENVSPVPSVSDGEKRILALTKSASASEANFPTPSVDNPSPSSIAMSSSGLLLEKSALTKSASSEVAERRSKSAGMLKLKLSTMMNFLNAQLELVDDLEREEKVNAESSKANELRNQVKSITESELETIISFRNKWKEFV